MNKNEIKKIMIFAGEASGDLQGAMLARELRKIEPDIEISGVGGIRMKQEGIQLLLDTTTLGVIGPWEGLKILPKLFFIYRNVRDAFVKTNPDLAIFIDAPAFGMRLAKLSRKEGIKTVYYFPPSAWSGSVKRAREIKDAVDLVINAFKFTADTYDRGNIDHYFTGHPLVDYMQPLVNSDRNNVLKELGIEEERRFIGLLPGSRSQELQYVLPILLDTAEKLAMDDPELFFLIPVASPVLKNKITSMVNKRNLPVRCFDGKAPQIMKIADLLIMASGSAALEAAILKTPMIITYKVNWLDYRLIKKFVKLRWVSLPNLIINEEIVPELLQENATVDKICSWSKDLLDNDEKRKKMINDLDRLNQALGKPGMVERIARHIWEKIF